MTVVTVDIKHTIDNKTFDYNVQLDKGITGIYGSSGAGKSTLLNIISGLIKPNSGRITVNNRCLFSSADKCWVKPSKRGIGYVFQDGRLFPHMTVKHNLIYSCKRSYSQPLFANIVDTLAIQDLLNRYPRDLSGGERQRVAIGRTLMSEPDILLFDEPFSNLDRNIRRQIISYLLDINRQYNIPMVIVSHIMGDILRLTDQVIFIKDQRVSMSGNVKTMLFDKGSDMKPSSMINIIDVKFCDKQSNKDILSFCSEENSNFEIKIGDTGEYKLNRGDSVRLAIRPDDIALSTSSVEYISIQNQIMGKVVKIIKTEQSCFCIVDCGVNLIAEVTDKALADMDIYTDKMVYCLVKAKAVEVIYPCN